MITLIKINTWLRTLQIRYKSLALVKKVQNQVWKKTPEYRAYINNQLQRTINKRQNKGIHTYILIDHIAEHTNLSRCDVLCVGSRNNTEIDYFRTKDVQSVKAIDLYSESPDILVMDMHNMTFKDNSFDVVFASHSLEHSFDSAKVISELVRVCRVGGLIAVEVPVNFEPSGSDLVDFKDYETLNKAFESYTKNVLWSDYQDPGSPSNFHKVAIIRTIISIR